MQLDMILQESLGGTCSRVAGNMGSTRDPRITKHRCTLSPWKPRAQKSQSVYMWRTDMSSPKMSSPKLNSPKLIRKLSSRTSRALRILVLGQPAVGKTALVVRFVTRRFIGDYDPTLERRYSKQIELDDEVKNFDIFDTVGQFGDEEMVHLEEKIKWADAFVLVYCITDRSSFEECTRLKFLITRYKRPRRVSSGGQTFAYDVPVTLVANKNDLEPERMVPTREGRARCKDLGCTSFHEISVRENVDDAFTVFLDLHKYYFSDSRCVKVAENARISPSSPRRRGNWSLIGQGMSIQDSEQMNEKETRAQEKRKRSVSKRIIGKVISSLSTKDSMETTKSDFDHAESN